MEKKYEKIIGHECVTKMRPMIELDDLVLPEDVRRIVEDVIEEQRNVSVLRSYACEPRNMILLMGPPGNGKGRLAEAIADSLGVSLCVIHGEVVASSRPGKTLSMLGDMVDADGRVILFDEFEMLWNESRYNGLESVDPSLTHHIYKMPSHIIVIGSVNYPYSVPKSEYLKFQLKFDLPAPGAKEIAEWFRKLQGRAIDIDFGYNHDELANRIVQISNEEHSYLTFSILEEFGASIFRKCRLAGSSKNIEKIIQQQLDDLKYQLN